LPYQLLFNTNFASSWSTWWYFIQIIGTINIADLAYLLTFSWYHLLRFPLVSIFISWCILIFATRLASHAYHRMHLPTSPASLFSKLPHACLKLTYHVLHALNSLPKSIGRGSPEYYYILHWRLLAKISLPSTLIFLLLLAALRYFTLYSFAGQLLWLSAKFSASIDFW
jgi:hypothetical protein